MLARILRTYGGQEGTRTKAGTVFSVDKAVSGLRTITLARFRQLKSQNLAIEVTASQLADDPARPASSPAPRNRAAPTPRNRQEPDSQQPPAPSPSQRVASRKRAQAEAPKEPRPLARRTGSLIGAEQIASSSSAVARPVGSSTLRQRGVRKGSAGSVSTTPGVFARTETSSMPATPPGGAPTETKPETDSAAFD